MSTYVGYANRVPITMRILAVVALSLVVLASALLAVVKGTVDAAVYAQSRDQAVHATKILDELVRQKGAPAIVGGKLRFGRWVANGDSSLVDEVEALAGADTTAALFQLRPDGALVRVATSVVGADGRRAVGAVLQGPAAAAFGEGRDYIGISPILGRPYIAEYDVVRDAHGRAVGMTYAGIPLAALDQISNGIVAPALTFALLVLAVTLLVLFVVLRRIGRAIGQVAAAAQGLARGELDGRIDVSSDDEVGRMAAAVRATIAYQARVAAAAAAVSEGDLKRQVPLAGEGDVLGRAFNAMVADLRARTDALVAAEVQTRTTAARLERGVTRLVEELAPVAEGDLTARPTISAEAGDVAVVADFTGVLIDSFADVARAVRDAAARVQQDGEHLGARVRHLARAVQERTAQVDETAAVAEHIAGSATDVLSAVEQVDRAAREAVASVGQGNAAVAQTLERMDAMRATMIGATRQLKRLSDSSVAMNGTVGLVLQFAGDLELLADNAQIEAARHSEAGGVFTAVAEQTGRLAEDAQKALADIQAAVLANRQETVEVGRQMEQMAAEVVSGARAVEEARGAFDAITVTVQELDSFVERVNSAARAQVEVARRVGAAMGGIAAFFEQTAADVRLSEADAAGLRHTIDELRASIANLKLEPGVDAGRAAA